nr:uncharacterized protein CTRU02_10512 [Colletotrichum truncatum]KAF6787249.1 hypothetical protein CTRU02_10512 [Colletotrichum truncatum]
MHDGELGSNSTVCFFSRQVWLDLVSEGAPATSRKASRSLQPQSPHVGCLALFALWQTDLVIWAIHP